LPKARARWDRVSKEHRSKEGRPEAQVKHLELEEQASKEIKEEVHKIC
jgi:hypothetical protein